MSRTHFLSALFFVTASAAICATANATVIFSDDFEFRGTPTVVGNGWIEENYDDDDVKIHGTSAYRFVRMRDGRNGPAISQEMLDTSGFGDIELSYSYNATGDSDDADSDALLDVLWKLSSDTVWTSLAQHALADVGGWSTHTVSISGAANTAISIRFAGVNLSSYNGGNLQLDDIVLIGAIISEPATLALLGLGLVGMGHCRRAGRKARAAYHPQG